MRKIVFGVTTQQSLKMRPLIENRHQEQNNDKHDFKTQMQSSNSLKDVRRFHYYCTCMVEMIMPLCMTN